eukprot:TRINITY_DN856_c0_g1_i4.p1 TRINITY_DN856_c0_g1~~TRINITY_DN856_c0_g1_i4.p1  ORF type:complete len:1076 (+),score=266.79 TRINITY_DN856_c0_g1_i4:60-3287(+)
MSGEFDFHIGDVVCRILDKSKWPYLVVAKSPFITTIWVMVKRNGVTRWGSETNLYHEKEEHTQYVRLEGATEWMHNRYNLAKGRYCGTAVAPLKEEIRTWAVPPIDVLKKMKATPSPKGEKRSISSGVAQPAAGRGGTQRFETGDWIRVMYVSDPNKKAHLAKVSHEGNDTITLALQSEKGRPWTTEVGTAVEMLKAQLVWDKVEKADAPSGIAPEKRRRSSTPPPPAEKRLKNNEGTSVAVSTRAVTAGQSPSPRKHATIEQAPHGAAGEALSQDSRAPPLSLPWTPTFAEGDWVRVQRKRANGIVLAQVKKEGEYSITLQLQKDGRKKPWSTEVLPPKDFDMTQDITNIVKVDPPSGSAEPVETETKTKTTTKVSKPLEPVVLDEVVEFSELEPGDFIQLDLRGWKACAIVREVEESSVTVLRWDKTHGYARSAAKKYSSYEITKIRRAEEPFYDVSSAASTQQSDAPKKTSSKKGTKKDAKKTPAVPGGEGKNNPQMAVEPGRKSNEVDAAYNLLDLDSDQNSSRERASRTPSKPAAKKASSSRASSGNTPKTIAAKKKPAGRAANHNAAASSSAGGTSRITVSTISGGEQPEADGKVGAKPVTAKAVQQLAPPKRAYAGRAFVVKVKEENGAALRVVLVRGERRKGAAKGDKTSQPSVRYKARVLKSKPVVEPHAASQGADEAAKAWDEGCEQTGMISTGGASRADDGRCRVNFLESEACMMDCQGTAGTLLEETNGDVFLKENELRESDEVLLLPTHAAATAFFMNLSSGKVLTAKDGAKEACQATDGVTGVCNGGDPAYPQRAEIDYNSVKHAQFYFARPPGHPSSSPLLVRLLKLAVKQGCEEARVRVYKYDTEHCDVGFTAENQEGHIVSKPCAGCLVPQSRWVEETSEERTIPSSALLPMKVAVYPVDERRPLYFYDPKQPEVVPTGRPSARQDGEMRVLRYKSCWVGTNLYHAGESVAFETKGAVVLGEIHHFAIQEPIELNKCIVAIDAYECNKSDTDEDIFWSLKLTPRQHHTDPRLIQKRICVTPVGVPVPPTEAGLEHYTYCDPKDPAPFHPSQCSLLARK